MWTRELPIQGRRLAAPPRPTPPACTPSTRPPEAARGSCWGGAPACVGWTGVREAPPTVSPGQMGETGPAFPLCRAWPGGGSLGREPPWAVHQLRVRPVWPLTASVSSSAPPATGVRRTSGAEGGSVCSRKGPPFTQQPLWLLLGSRDEARHRRTFRRCAERPSLREPRTRPR